MLGIQACNRHLPQTDQDNTSFHHSSLHRTNNCVEFCLHMFAWLGKPWDIARSLTGDTKNKLWSRCSYNKKQRKHQRKSWQFSMNEAASCPLKNLFSQTFSSQKFIILHEGPKIWNPLQLLLHPSSYLALQKNMLGFLWQQKFSFLRSISSRELLL